MFDSNRQTSASILTLAAVLITAPAVAMELGQTVSIRRETGNRAINVTLHNAALVESYGDTRAPDGRAFLVLNTTWENVLPPQISAANQQKTVAYKIPDLAEHVYLVLNGRTVVRAWREAASLPGNLKLRDFGLAALGDSTRGNLLFELPKDVKVQSLGLRYYDLTHGHFNAQVFGKAPELPKALLGYSDRNEVLEMAGYALERSTELAGRKAPAGMTFVTLDVRARSTYKTEADATAFDPRAKPGAKSLEGIFVDWNESRKYLHLVADNEYAYLPEPQTTLPEVPRFLPDVMTGGSVVFLIPEKVKSLELYADFPNARAGARVFRPPGLDMLVEGSAPSKLHGDGAPIAALKDDFFTVSVVAQKVAEEFAGRTAPQGKKFLVLDVSVKNDGKGPEFFQVKEQLKFAPSSGGELPLSDATFAGPYRPTPLVWIPRYERRTFQVVYEMPAAEARPRLAYAGISLAKVLDLQPIGGAVAVGPNVGDPGMTTTRPAVATTGPAVGTTRPAVVVTPQPPAVIGKKDLPIRVAARQPYQPRGIAGVGLTPEQVNASIDRGGKFLWNKVREEMLKKKANKHHFDKEDMLFLLALVHADMHKKSPECDAMVSFVLETTFAPELGTYGTGLYLMLAESYGDAQFMPQAKDAARSLVEAQGTDGSWGYSSFEDPKFFKQEDTEGGQVLQVRGGTPLEGPGSIQEPIKRVTPYLVGLQGDNSCTQYALLGLYSAMRMGIPIPAETWKRCEDELRKRQCNDGGWAYHHKSNSYGSMLCAGIAAMALCRHGQGDKSPATDEAVEKGLGWFDANFSVTENPGYGEPYLYYYLYGMERVGRILDTEFIGDHEWYPYGTRFLISKQNADGSWKHTASDEQREEIGTSFALLFLTRATPSLGVAKKTGPGTLRTELVKPPVNRVYIILDCSGSMLEEVAGRQKFQYAQDAVLSLVNDLPPNSEVALRVYGHRKRGIDPGASEDTQLLIPMSQLDKKKFTETLSALRARGRTPMARSLVEAAQDLKATKEQITLVMLTDGGEDSLPRQDPVKAAGELAAFAHVNFQLVGFDINREDWTEQLTAMGQAGRGRYLPAAKADVLLAQLRQAVYRTPDGFVVRDSTDRVLAQGQFGDPAAKLQPGKYTLATTLGNLQFTRDLWINAESTTNVRFDAGKVDWRQAGVVPIAKPATPLPPATAPVTPPPAIARFCTNCGKPLTPGAKFCTSCGQKVK